MKLMRAKRREKRKRGVPKGRRENEYPPSSPVLTRSQTATSEAELAAKQYRIVNWFHLSNMSQVCSRCGKGPLNLKNTTSEKQAGLAYTLWIRCDHCEEINKVQTDEFHTAPDQRGPKRSKLNERCVLGTIHSGNGHAQSEHLLAPMEVKCMTSKAYKSIERSVGPQIEKVARKSCSDWLEKEATNETGTNNLAISYDMG